MSDLSRKISQLYQEFEETVTQSQKRVRFTQNDENDDLDCDDERVDIADNDNWRDNKDWVAERRSMFIDGVYTCAAFDAKLSEAGLSHLPCAVRGVRVIAGMAGEMKTPEAIVKVDNAIAFVRAQLDELCALAARVDLHVLPDAFTLSLDVVFDGSVPPISLLAKLCTAAAVSGEVTWRAKLVMRCVPVASALDDQTIQDLKIDIELDELEQLTPIFGLHKRLGLAWLNGVENRGVSRAIHIARILKQYHHSDLYGAIVVQCKRKSTAQISDFVFNAMAMRRAELFDSIVHDNDAVVCSWDKRNIKSNVVQPMRARLARIDILVGDFRTPQIVVDEAVELTRAAIARWKADTERKQAVLSQRKAALDRLLRARGFAPDASGRDPETPDDDFYVAPIDERLFHNRDRRAVAASNLWGPVAPLEFQPDAPLLSRLRLNRSDVAALESMVMDVNAPVRLPVRVALRSARRAAILAHLRDNGVLERRIPLSVNQFGSVLFRFLCKKQWPRSRATAAALSGDVAQSIHAGDIFASLPQRVLALICDFVANHTDIHNLSLVSDAFALAAAVWVVNRKRDREYDYNILQGQRER